MSFNYKALYSEYEQLVEAFNWPVSESRKLTYRERKHWIKRYLYKLEQEYERMHQLNNATQTITRSVGQGTAFSNIPFR